MRNGRSRTSGAGRRSAPPSRPSWANPKIRLQRELAGAQRKGNTVQGGGGADCTGAARDLTVGEVFFLRRALAPRRIVAVLAALVVSFMLLPGAALCVGGDGHFAVEPLGSECGPPATHGGDASLHGCTDTVLGAATLQGQSDPGRRALCTPACSAVPAASADPPCDDPRGASRAPRVRPPVARGTVLQL